MNVTVWIVVSALFGPLSNTPKFTNQTGCELYLHNAMAQVRQSFQVRCVQTVTSKEREESDE